MKKSKPLSIIIDTNLWISFIISNKQNQLDALLYYGKARLLFSTELIFEISATIPKPKLRKYFSSNALEEMLTNLDPFIDLVEVNSSFSICRDSKDDFLLGLADGKADYLLTGDYDLLKLKKMVRLKSSQSPRFYLSKSLN